MEQNSSIQEKPNRENHMPVYQTVGASLPRVDALEKVSGKARYPGDFQFPDQLTMKVLFAHRAHAIVRAIHVEEALAVPGVVMILTAKDVPNNEYGLGKMDQPVLCGPGSAKPYGDRVRFEGDQVALVIAENERAAVQALKAIRVEYEDLPVVTDVMEAMREDAVRVHRSWRAIFSNIILFALAMLRLLFRAARLFVSGNITPLFRNMPSCSRKRAPLTLIRTA